MQVSPALRQQQAGGDVQEGGFAAPVGPTMATNLARADAEAGGGHGLIARPIRQREV